MTSVIHNMHSRQTLNNYKKIEPSKFLFWKSSLLEADFSPSSPAWLSSVSNLGDVIAEFISDLFLLKRKTWLIRTHSC